MEQILQVVKPGEICFFSDATKDFDYCSKTIECLQHNTLGFNVVNIPTSNTELINCVTVRHFNLCNLHTPEYLIYKVSPIGISINDVLQSLYAEIADIVSWPIYKAQINHTFDSYKEYEDEGVYAFNDLIPINVEIYFPEVDHEEINNDREEWIEEIYELALSYAKKYHEYPPIDIIKQRLDGKLVIDEKSISPLKLTHDMKLILTDYHNTEIKMGPLPKAVYILFLRHPEGIRLKDISDYYTELIDIYRKVKPGADECLAIRSIKAITDYSNELINQKMSRIRESIDRVIIVPKLAEYYDISKSGDGLYRIYISSKFIDLPLTNI